MRYAYGIVALLSALGLGMPASPAVTFAGPRLAVYESEANAAEYHGQYQGRLRDWLTSRGLKFTKIGDKQASDAAALKAFTVVLTTNSYIVPDGVCAGLAEYVRAGGRLIWIDGPTRTQNAQLTALLGLAGHTTYLSMRRAQFKMLLPGHPACAGIGDFTSSVVSNSYTATTGQTLATFAAMTGAPGQQRETIFPAVTVTRTGQGRAALINYIPWNSSVLAVRAILGNVLQWFVADRALQQSPAVLYATPLPGELAQPKPVRFSARLFAHRQSAGASVLCKARLTAANGHVMSRSQGQLDLHSVPGEQYVFGATDLSLPTVGLDDGDYQAQVETTVGNTLHQVAQKVHLSGQLLARLAQEEHRRAALLRPILQGTLGDYDAEPRNAKGRVDLPKLFDAIKAAHMNTYDFLIWHAKTDWEDFQEFAKEAKQRGLKVWITLAPPSEPPPSAPFGLDYIKWADEIGKLSQKYPNIVAMVIDDFWSGSNHALFTPSYIARVAEALRARNPKLAFLPTIYWPTIGDANFIANYHSSIDGIVFPYADLVSTKSLPSQLRACRRWIGPDKLLMINVYASGGSGSGQGQVPRTAQYMRSILTISHEMCDGIREYCLPLGNYADPRFAVTAQLYGEWHGKPWPKQQR